MQDTSSESKNGKERSVKGLKKEEERYPAHVCMPST